MKSGNDKSITTKRIPYCFAGNPFCFVRYDIVVGYKELSAVKR